MTPAGSDGWKGLMNENFSVKLETEEIYVYQCDPSDDGNGWHCSGR